MLLFSGCDVLTVVPAGVSNALHRPTDGPRRLPGQVKDGQRQGQQ